MEPESKIRIRIPFPAKVRGVDAGGEAFETDLRLESLTSSGLYMRLPRAVELGTRLFIIIRLSMLPEHEDTGARVAARGVVVGAEELPDGYCRTAVDFTSRRFF
jgi:hypothetical protein